MKQKLVIAAFAMLVIAVAANLQYAFSGYGIKESVSLRHAIMAQAATETDPTPDGESTIQCDRSSKGQGQCFKTEKVVYVSWPYLTTHWECTWDGYMFHNCSLAECFLLNGLDATRAGTSMGWF